MAYSGIKTGTFYPTGGFGKVIDGFVSLCKELGVKFETDVNIEQILVEKIKGEVSLYLQRKICFLTTL